MSRHDLLSFGISSNGTASCQHVALFQSDVLDTGDVELNHSIFDWKIPSFSEPLASARELMFFPWCELPEFSVGTKP